MPARPGNNAAPQNQRFRAQSARGRDVRVRRTPGLGRQMGRTLRVAGTQRAPLRRPLGRKRAPPIVRRPQMARAAAPVRSVGRTLEAAPRP